MPSLKFLQEIALLSPVRPDPADVASFLGGGSGYGWPSLLARGVLVRCGEAGYRAFADICTAGQLEAVIGLVVESEEPEGVL